MKAIVFALRSFRREIRSGEVLVLLFSVALPSLRSPRWVF
jgi:hypothetical protein